MKKGIVIAYVIAKLVLLSAFCATGQTTWTPNKKYIKTATRDTTGTAKKVFQCWGTTQKGERCKHKVNAEHAKCWQHIDQK